MALYLNHISSVWGTMYQYTKGWKIPATRLTQVCLRMTGVSQTNGLVYVIKVALMMITLAQTFTSLCLNWKHKKEVFRVANDFNAITYGTCLVVTFGLRNHRMTQLFLLLQEGLFKYSTPLSKSQETAKEKEIFKIQSVEKLFIVSSIIGTITFFISPMVFGLMNCLEGKFENLVLPLSPWHPFELNSTTLYLVAYLFEFCIALVVVIYHISWLSCLYTSILCLQGEMKILALAFSNLETTATQMMHKSKHRGRNNLDYYMQMSLKECIQHHQMIIK